MKRKHIAALSIIAGSILCAAAKDEIIMTVNGVDVPRSEFEYLYHKNQQQQVDPQSLEEYAEMFKIYKLKVADALDHKLDTMSAFIKEMDQYKQDLATPYMTDSLYLNSLVKEAYDFSREEVEAFHIMLAKSPSDQETRQAKAQADSIRSVLLNGGDFAELAAKFSVDRASSNNGGRMGYIVSGRFPYAFEKAAYTLAPGQISEIVESPQGFHILKGGKHRPARGTVLVEHIMKMVPPTATAEQQAAAKATIDSIYNAVVANPNSFEDLARELSDDKGSGRQGGKLNWFGAGMMVEPFDSASFALEVNEISLPVKSQYGWHIIRKLDAKAPASLAELKPQVLKRIANPQDDRYDLVDKNLISRLQKKHKGMLNEKNIDALCSEIKVNGLDSTWHARALDPAQLGGIEIARVGKNSITLAEWAATVRPMVIPDGEEAAYEFRRYVNHHLENSLKAAEYDWLYANEPDYRNLLNEYREGSLLYEASLREVWDKAAKDNDGLTDYFNAHKDEYKWTKPHVKGILVQATNDSVASLVRTGLREVSDDNGLKALKKQFVGKASMDRILMEEGQNPMVDNVIFGGDPVTPNNKKYTVYFIFEPKLLEAPETMTDVRSLVTSDYQNKLEKDWVESLKTRYPVKVNEKVLKKVK
ncbi:MAG: peptidylprolyl isomerase [Muribaculaceae bacterium]|nr:peptidylprolyl isomerase [Muribaculaceae bacterium]